MANPALDDALDLAGALGGRAGQGQVLDEGVRDGRHQPRVIELARLEEGPEVRRDREPAGGQEVVAGEAPEEGCRDAAADDPAGGGAVVGD